MVKYLIKLKKNIDIIYFLGRQYYIDMLNLYLEELGIVDKK